MSAVGRIEPVTLEGRVVRLEPLTPAHVPELLAAAQPEEVWQWTIADPRTREGMEEYVAEALRERESGTAFPFAVHHLADGKVIGSTRYHSASFRDRVVEIGWTWYNPAYWRSAVNTECKLLLLTHAFERMGMMRVELKTDARNVRSRAAIARLGAVEEGTLRSKMIMRDGYRRDTVYFGILAAEWPLVKERLTRSLDR